MGDTGGQTEDKEKEPVDSFSKELSSSGLSDGVALHFDAGFASEYGLDPDTEVEVKVVEKDGDVAFEIDNIPAGFTSDELRTFAGHQDWEKTDEYINPDADEWYLTYRSNDGNVRIEIDSESRINGNVVNNVVIEGDPIDVTGDYDTFARLCAAAQRKEIRVKVDDSEGNWERLKASAANDTDDIPDEQTFEQLSDAADAVVAQLVCQKTSLNTSLRDLKEVVDAIKEAYQTIED
jgi:exonuclease VII small subunit